MFLYDDITDLREDTDHLDALCERFGRKTVVAHHLGVREHADRDASERCRRTQEILVSFVDNVGAKAGVDCFHMVVSLLILQLGPLFRLLFIMKNSTQ